MAAQENLTVRELLDRPDFLARVAAAMRRHDEADAKRPISLKGVNDPKRRAHAVKAELLTMLDEPADLMRVSMVMPGDYAPEAAESLVGQETTFAFPDGHRQPGVIVAADVVGTRLTATVETARRGDLQVLLDRFENRVAFDG